MELTLDNYFDKVFYINLKKDTDRNQNMINQFNQFGITNYERFEGVEPTQGYELDLNSESVKYSIRNFIKNDYRYVLGTYYCRKSHLEVIKLSHQRGYKRVLILEDDVIFLADPNQLLSFNANILNDWDMMYFGGLIEHNFRNQIVEAHAYSVKHTLFKDIINMCEPSGMEVDNFYAKIIQHMSYNYNQSGKYNIRTIQPFNQIVQNKRFGSNIQK